MGTLICKPGTQLEPEPDAITQPNCVRDYHIDVRRYPNNLVLAPHKAVRWDPINVNGIWCKLYRGPEGYYQVWIPHPSNFDWYPHYPTLQAKISDRLLVPKHDHPILGVNLRSLHWQYNQAGDYDPNLDDHKHTDTYYSRRRVLTDIHNVTQYMSQLIPIPATTNSLDYMRLLYQEDVIAHPCREMISLNLQGLICELYRHRLGYFYGRIIPPDHYNRDLDPQIQDFIAPGFLQDWTFHYSWKGDYIPLAEEHQPDDVYHTYQDVLIDLTLLTTYLASILVRDEV